MTKDIIYIDTEDDITSIIGKIKASKDKVVTLVPPKRTGVLQSAVNLRLLARTAKTSDKKLALITNNKALIALSASAKIPVAKNLQSEPELAEIAALEVDDGEDIIDGANLPIGELVKTTDFTKKDDKNSDIVSGIDIDNEGPQPSKTPVKSGIKVPNFLTFRKKLFLGIAAGILLLIFLIWAIWFAPAATIIINAKTEPAPVSATLKLGGTETDISKGIIQTIVKQVKKDVSVEFTATGQKDLGGKATGSITIRNCDYSDGFTLSAGTEFTSVDGKVFLSTASVSVPKFTGSSNACTFSGVASGKATVQVQASSGGDSYNNSGVAYTISTIPVGAKVDANGTAMTGGSTRMVTVVTVEDVQKASQALVDLPANDVKQQLTKQFTNGEYVIGDSFAIDRAAAVSVPAVGAEATAAAKLTSATTFSLTAIAKSELQAFLKDAINKQTSDSQRIYSDGIDKVKFSGYLKNEKESFVNIATVGRIGPDIKQDTIKNQVKGKRYGDVQALLEGIKGINSVDIKFSYFWVNTVPGDVNKIQVKFEISND